MERINPETGEIFTTAEERVLATAHHESGHSIVARSLNGSVSKETVVRKGNILGYVQISFEHFPFREKLHRTMAALAGGWVAEEKIGKSDHSGCGSDMGQLDLLADYTSKFIYSGRVSAQRLKSEAFSLARSVLSNQSHLNQKALLLYQKQTIV